MRIQSFRILVASSLTGLLLTACGSGSDLASNYSDLSASLDSSSLQSSTDSSQSDDVAAAIPKILQGLQDIKEEIQALDGNYTAPAAPASQTQTPAAPSLDPSTTSNTPASTPSSTAPAPSAPAKPAAPSPQERGMAELKALMNKIATTPYVQLTAEKVERNLDSGKISTNKIQMWSKQPNIVKINILESTSGSAGVQALYTSGVGDTVKVKKLFIKLDLAKTDDKVVSNNGYTADQIDLFGVSKRMASGYSAELIGTSQLNGVKINVLKVTCDGTNTLDSRVGYEYLGYEPGTYKIRLWEAYDKSGNKQPFYRMTIPEIAYPASLPDNTFNL